MKLGDLNHDNQVNVTDIMTLVDIVMNGYSPFSVSPTEVTMQAGGTANVTIYGGYYVYEVESANPDIVNASLSGLTVTLTAVAGGETTVTVKDVLTFRTIDIPVVVNYESLQVSSNELSLIAGERGTVEINSGSGYYSVQSSDANVSTATVSGGTVTVIAVSTGSANITITDIKTEQTVVINVKVGYKPIALSSSSLGLSIGDESKVSVTSGSGSYDVQSSDANVATAVLDGSSVVVTAVGGGTATITVTDMNSGLSATITVTVEYFPLTLSASSLKLNVGDEESVNITSGNGSFTVVSSDTGVATAKLVGFSVKVTAVGAGTATITVTDTKSGKTATIEVTVEDNQPQSYLTCPDDHHPHLIDLGLPSGTKWACCNVGADKPEAYGGYYAWGETKTKTTYDWSTYIHCDGSSYTCHNLGSDIAGTQYDVAHVKWGGSWVMPSKEQQDELKSNCTYEWTMVNGVNGGKFTSETNGGCIFLPAAGYRWNGDLGYAGGDGGYWSSTQVPSGSGAAYGLYFNSGGMEWYYGHHRYYGHGVRPVVGKYMPLTLSISSLNLNVGEESTINIISGSGSYSIEESDIDVVTASLSGSSITVKAVAAGTATITVTDTKRGLSATITVTVEYSPLTLSALSLELNIGDEETVNITSGNGTFTLTSSDIGVATAKLVGFSVKVTALGVGTAIITVMDCRSEETATIEVTVKDNHPQSYLTCPDDHHPHLIDLGLPSGTKWACCNVGADKPEAYGGYYAWGETEEKEVYNWGTYIHCDGSYDTCKDLGSDIAGTQYDVAHVKWDGS